MLVEDCWNVILGGGLAPDMPPFGACIIKSRLYGRMNDRQFADSRLRTAKARRIKNIVLASVLVALSAYLIITYLPVLQKAFMI